MRIALDGHPASVARARAVLDHFGARLDGPARDRIEVIVSTTSRPPEPDGPIVARHLDLVVHRDGDLVIVGPTSTTRICDDGAVARIALHDGGPVPLHVLTCALFHQLRLRGRYALHAAMVARDGRACAIVGPSGAGKSTLTLALARAGWSLVSDDSVLLAREGRQVRALALRRGIYLDPRRHDPPPGAVFVPCPLVEGTKQELVLPTVRRAEAAVPVVVLLPRLADRDRSVLAPADPAEACYALAAESRLGELDWGGAADHLGVLVDLAGAARAWRAELGRDVLAGAQALSDRLAGLLDEVTDAAIPRRSASVLGLEAAWCPLGGEGGVLLHRHSHELVHLDPIGARIWELAAAGDPTSRLAAELGLSHAEARAEVAHLREALAEAGFALGRP